jgi:hypothetical protein
MLRRRGARKAAHGRHEDAGAGEKPICPGLVD